MNDEQERIEEMAKVIQGIMYYAPDEEDDRYRYLTHLDKKSAKEISEKLYAAGYRKQSDTAREIKEKIFEKGQFFFSKVFSKDIYEVSFTMTLDEFNKIVAQYGVEVEE